MCGSSRVSVAAALLQLFLDYISRHKAFIFIRISKRETHRFRWERLGCDSARGVDNELCLFGVSIRSRMASTTLLIFAEPFATPGTA